MNSSLVTNNQGIEAEPEKDNLVILKERLSRSRISSLNSSRLSGDLSQNGYSDFKLNLNDDPIKRLDSMIVQNSKILGENYMPPSSTWKNQNSMETKTLLSNAESSFTPGGAWLNSKGSDFPQMGHLGMSNGGFNQSQAKNNSDDFGVRNNNNNDNNFGKIPDGPYLQQQQQYLIATNNTNSNNKNNNQLYPTYQSVIYDVPQQANNNNSNVQGVQYFQVIQSSQNVPPSSENNKLNYPLIQQSSYPGNINMM